MSNDAPVWKIYERLVTSFEVEAIDMDASVTPNATLLGSISGVQRQIDVLVDARWDDGLSRRIIFDAKRRSRKVDVTDVEAFEGLMRDVRASRGVPAAHRVISPAQLSAIKRKPTGSRRLAKSTPRLPEGLQRNAKKIGDVE